MTQRVAARLQHPNIVQIYSMDQLPSGEVVLVTEYVEGQSLSQVIEKSKGIPVVEALRIGLSIANALQVAHKNSIVHRDVKPTNILFAKDGEVKLLDFGIAKPLHESASAEITAPGGVIGTPAYMSPEQIQGKDIDPRTDLYALGAVFYEMLTGRHYLQGGSLHELMFKVMTENPVPPSEINPTIPPELDRIVMKCLEKNPKDRYTSATELIGDLERILEYLKE